MVVNLHDLKEADVKCLFESRYAKFVAFAGKFVELEIAKDLVQDVFLKLLTKCDTLNISGTLEAYVYKAIKNKFLDYVRSKKLHSKYHDQIAQLGMEELDYYDPSAHLSLTLSEREQSLYDAIENLPPKCREIIKERYLYGKKTIQISKKFGISPRTVETHIYKAIKYLKISLHHAGLFFSWILALVAALMSYLS